MRLEPLLAELFRPRPALAGGALEASPMTKPIELRTRSRTSGCALRADRIKPVVRVLIDLFDTGGSTPMRRCACPRSKPAAAEALNDTGRWQFRGDESIGELAQRLQAGRLARGRRCRAACRRNCATYQREGLNWMQFLREHDLAGVLADDMGLGKTVQTLAHILAEKEAGRLDRPALIVVPTTLVHNWREEARRFAPGSESAGSARARSARNASSRSASTI